MRAATGLWKRARRALASLFLAAAPLGAWAEVSAEMLSKDAVIVQKAAVGGDEPYAIIQSNINYINALRKALIYPTEISRDAQRSYYVDYYMAQIKNGGFSQFVYNSRWNDFTITLLREGLQAMGASEHLERFNTAAEAVEALGPEALNTYFERAYSGANPVRDRLNDIGADLLSPEPSLLELNSKWLHSLPTLQALSVEEMEAQVALRAEATPDMAERRAEALENEPRYTKLIRALSAKAGHAFSHVTAGDPSHRHNGVMTLAWHFFTDKGHHYMVEADGAAIMFQGGTDKKIAEISAP